MDEASHSFFDLLRFSQMWLISLMNLELRRFREDLDLNFRDLIRFHGIDDSQHLWVVFSVR